MHEEHKKVHKKEEKKNKMHEKKAMKSKSAEHESKKSKEKKSQKKANKDKEKFSEEHDKDMSSNNLQSVAVSQPKQESEPEEKPEPEEEASSSQDDDETTEESVQNPRKQHRRSSSQPMLVSASFSTLRPTLPTPSLIAGNVAGYASRQQHANSITLSRLLNANHDEDKIVRSDAERSNISHQNNSTGVPYAAPRKSANETVPSNHLRSLPQITISPQRHPMLDLNDIALTRTIQPSKQVNQSDTNHRFPPDLTRTNHQRHHLKVIAMQRHNASSALGDKANATILDIVDHLTGRQMNKSKIGTYELEGGHGGVANETVNAINENNNNNTLNRVMINNMARYNSAHVLQSAAATNTSLPASRAAHNRVSVPGNHQPMHVPDANKAPNKVAQQQSVASGPHQQKVGNNVDAALLLSLIQKATSSMRQQIKQQEPKQQIEHPFGDPAVFQRPFVGNQAGAYTPLSNQNFELTQRQQLQPMNGLTLARPQQQPIASSQPAIAASQAEAAARLLRHLAGNKPMSGQQQQQLNGNNLLESSEHYPHLQHLNSLNQRLQPDRFVLHNPLAVTYQKQPVIQMPSFAGSANNNPIGQFGAEQLLDYESYPLS